MERTVRIGERLALFSIIAVAIALVALPAQASARIATKVTVTKQVRVDNSVAGTTPASPVITAKLYRRRSGRWVALSKPVLCYFMDPQTGRLSLVGKKTGSKVTFALPKYGQYELMYAGSNVFKSAKAYSKRIDLIGATVSTPTVAITLVDDTYSLVTYSAEVTWNAGVYAGPMSFAYMGFFTEHPGDGFFALLGPTSSYTLLAHVIGAPQTVEFSYKFKTSEAVGALLIMANVSPEGTQSCVEGGPGSLTFYALEQPD